MTFAHRLREERERIGVTQTALGLRIGAAERSMKAWERGESEPNAKYLIAMAEAGIDALYLLTGRRETAPSTGADAKLVTTLVASPAWGAIPLSGDGSELVAGALLAPAASSDERPLVLPVVFGTGQDQTTREFQVIPNYTAAAAAGRRSGTRRAMEEAATDVAGVMAFDRAWMRDALGRDGPGFLTVSVTGDSMAPTLQEGDTIVVDTGVERIGTSGIYVIRHGLDLLVKRIQLKFDGTLVLKSDNKAYADETLAGDHVRLLQVIGRMVWPRVV